LIILKSPEEVRKIKYSSMIVAEILNEVKKKAIPGITTLELDRISEDLAKKRGVKPAFKGYRGFPFSLCTSLNNEIVHGLPSKRVLKEGDILSLDFGVIYDGYYGDAAITFPVGKVLPEAERLLRITEESLYIGVKMAQKDNRVFDISYAIQSYAENNGFSVVKDFVGHGIGKNLHEDPQIPNFGKPGTGIRLRVGMVFTIEPMINVGKSEVTILPNGWTAVTRDGSLSAHFEHTIVITEEGPIILSEFKEVYA